jgi:hypothetical protein
MGDGARWPPADRAAGQPVQFSSGKEGPTPDVLLEAAVLQNAIELKATNSCARLPARAGTLQ